MSQYNSKPNEPGKSTGALFVNDYKEDGDRKPDLTGNLDITKEQITELIEKGKAGKDVKLKLSCWIYPSKKNPEQDRFFIVADSTEFKKAGATPSDAQKDEWNDDDVPF